MVFNEAKVTQFIKQKTMLKHSQTQRMGSLRSESVNSEEKAEEIQKYEQEITHKNQDFEVRRKKLTIPPSGTFYQIWKIVGITLALSSSFEYAYYATYLHLMTDEERQFFEVEDTVYIFVFLTDTLVHILLDEHQESEGKWTVKGSCAKQLKNKLILHILALIPFNTLLNGVVSPYTCQLTYLVKLVRLSIGLELLD